MKSSTNFCLLGDCSHAPFHRTHPELFSPLSKRQTRSYIAINRSTFHVPISGQPNFFEGKSTGFCPLSNALIYELPILLGKPFHSFFGLYHNFYGLNMVKHGFLHGPPSFLLVKPSFFWVKSGLWAGRRQRCSNSSRAAGFAEGCAPGISSCVAGFALFFSDPGKF